MVTPEKKSWFRRFLFRSKEVLTSEQVAERLKKIERAVELEALEKPQAEADKSRLEAAAAMLNAIGDNDAVIQIGSVLMVKHTNPSTGKVVVAVRNLTQKELLYIEENPSLLSAPSKILPALDQPQPIEVKRNDGEEPLSDSDIIA